MQVDSKQCATYVDDSILDNFMSSHEQSNEHFVNRFTSLSLQDKKKVTIDYCNKDDCKSSLKSNCYCQQQISQMHDNERQKIQQRSRQKCSNTDNSKNWDNKIVTNNILEVENWNNVVQVDNCIHQIQPVDITSQYGKEVHTGGIINCMTCNAMDVSPTYDNYLTNVQHILRKQTINEQQQQQMLMRSVHIIPCFDVNSQCNAVCSTATLLKAITQPLQPDEGKGDQDNQSKVIDVVAHNNTIYQREKSIDDHKKVSVVTDKNEQVHKQLQLQQNQSIISNNSITLPGVDNTQQQNFCTDSAHNTNNSNDLKQKTKNKSNIDVIKNPISIAQLQSIINEDDDCVHPFQAYNQYEMTQLNQTQLCSNASKDAENVDRQNAHNATNTSIDVLGKALRYHSYVERVQSQQQLTKNIQMKKALAKKKKII